MGRDRTQQGTPDLFSTASSGETSLPATKQVSSAEEGRHVLPKDLTNAVKHLDDRDLDMLVASDAFFFIRRVQLVNLASRHGVAAAYSTREFAEAGGLLSYGPDLPDAYRQAGIYVGRILKGTKPAELPVVQSSKFEIVINHETARMLGVTVPPSLLAIADEVIE
jgi:putative ABC transport system substrate-binding protein